VRIRIWGARASIPTPCTTEFRTTRYGGNTTCLSVSVPGALAIFDAGSGIRPLGLGLDAEQPVRATVFFTHLHWDHIQGFPFFPPLYRSGNRFDLYGSQIGAEGALRRALSVQQDAVYFPVGLDQLSAELHFHELIHGQAVVLEGKASRLLVTPCALNHPGGCFGFRIDEQSEEGRGSTVFFATDSEPPVDGQPQLAESVRGASLLIHDAQYSPQEYEGRNGISRKGWGHSTWREALREAQAAGVRRLLLTHHDPQHDDWEIARLESEARVAGRRLDIDVQAVHEGMEIDL
jgi:phosphoribosyl 1,2-cyclic phosphodiesterase